MYCFLDIFIFFILQIHIFFWSYIETLFCFFFFFLKKKVRAFQVFKDFTIKKNDKKTRYFPTEMFNSSLNTFPKNSIFKTIL